MKTSRRWLISNRLYEACIRVKAGIPFTTARCIRMIIEGILARAQRDDKIILCHMLWMGNHAHFLFVVKDAEKCSQFFCEVQKQITDAMKKLLGLRHLNLWEGEPSIAEVLDIDEAKQRIRYIYCNPARANLVDSITDYDGASSWIAFSQGDTNIYTRIERRIPWIRRRLLPTLSKNGHIGRIRDTQLVEYFHRVIKERCSLTFFPFAWLAAFGISSPDDVKAIRNEVLQDISIHEEKYRKARIAAKKPLIGREALYDAPINRTYLPKVSRFRIYVLSSCKLKRLQYIAAMKELVLLCRELYLRACRGEKVTWPLGIFPPRIPMLGNALASA